MSTSFVGVSYKLEKFSPIYSSGNTLYVGGNGPGNYTKIQQAIDIANDGDTVFVYNGFYNENIEIDKSIKVIGEDKNITFINYVFEPPFTAFSLKAGNIVLKDFTVIGGDAGICITSSQEQIANVYISDCNLIDNEGNALYIRGDWVENISVNRCYFDNDFDQAIRILPWTQRKISNISFSYCYIYEDAIDVDKVTGLQFKDCYFNISEINICASSDNVQFYNCTMDSSPEIFLSIDHCSYILIENCTITNSNWEAMRLYDCRRVVIRNCFIDNSEEEDADGIVLWSVNHALIEGCIVENSTVGIDLYQVRHDIIVRNCHIANNEFGVSYYYWAVFNRIIKNNFINNEYQLFSHARFIFHFYKYNYWDDWNGTGAYNVWGILNWDRNPVSEPYNI